MTNETIPDDIPDPPARNSHNHYPDLDPDGLGDLKSIKRIPGMAKRAPKIAWDKKYLGWSIRERLKFAEALASSMNAFPSDVSPRMATNKPPGSTLRES